MVFFEGVEGYTSDSDVHGMLPGGDGGADHPGIGSGTNLWLGPDDGDMNLMGISSDGDTHSYSYELSVDDGKVVQLDTSGYAGDPSGYLGVYGDEKVTENLYSLGAVDQGGYSSFSPTDPKDLGSSYNFATPNYDPPSPEEFGKYGKLHDPNVESSVDLSDGESGNFGVIDFASDKGSDNYCNLMVDSYSSGEGDNYSDLSYNKGSDYNFATPNYNLPPPEAFGGQKKWDGHDFKSSVNLPDGDDQGSGYTFA